MTDTGEDRHIQALADALRGFIRTPGVGIVGIEAGPSSAADVKATVLGFEHHADNASPFLAVEVVGCSCAGDAWESGVDKLREAHDASASEGAPLRPLGPKPLGDDPAANFSVQLLHVLATVDMPAKGIMLILTLRGEVDVALLAQLATMARSDELAEVRFILCANPEAEIAPWVARLGSKRAWFHRVEHDATESAARLQRALEAEEEQGPGLRGAWPRGIKPPPMPRRRRPGAVFEQPLAIVSVPDVTEMTSASDVASSPEREADSPQDDGEAELQRDIQRAELAMRQDRGAEAIRIQTRARDRCIEQGRDRDAIEMEFMLAGYLLKLDQPRLARESFGRASQMSTEAGEYELAAKALINQGSAAEKDDDTVGAMRSYRRAIEMASGLGSSPPTAMDAYWRAGQLALASGLDLDCIGLWADAVAYGQKVEPKTLRGSRAKEIAKNLSELLVRHRRYSQAREIERLATEF